MKKFFSSLMLLFISLTLLACGQTKVEETTDSQPKESQSLTLKVAYPDKDYEQVVVFEEGDTVMDILKANLEIEEEGGLVTTIEGVSQDPSTSTYWMYQVNDQLADVGAAEYKPKAKDVVRFYQEKFE